MERKYIKTFEQFLNEFKNILGSFDEYLKELGYSPVQYKKKDLKSYTFFKKEYDKIKDSADFEDKHYKELNKKLNKLFEEGDTPEEITGAEKETSEKDSDKIKPDYSEVDPTPTKIMQALNKAGFDITEKDIIKWDGDDGEDSDGDLLVKINDDEKYFTVENGLLYYQLSVERVMLGKLNSTDEIVSTIKDYFEINPEDKKEKKDNKENDTTNAKDIADKAAEDDLGL